MRDTRYNGAVLQGMKELAKHDEPYLYLLRSAEGDSESILRAVHLPYGERWVHRERVHQHIESCSRPHG